MASRSKKRFRMASGSGSGSGKVLVQNWDVLRQCSASRSRKEEGEEEEEQGKKSAELDVIFWFWMHGRFYFYAISCYDDKWSSEGNRLRIEFPFPTSPYRRFLGSSNGLLCYEFYKNPRLSNDNGTKCVVWEPSTSKFQLIPKPSSMHIPCDCPSNECFPEVTTDASGLWFDSQSGDCKFVSFTQNCNYRPNFHQLSYHAQVYSVKNNAWKELTYPRSKEKEKENFNEEIVPNADGVCVNGVCYWLTLCVDDFSFILSFNFVTEEFSSVHAPEIVDLNNAYTLVDLDGSVGVLIYPAEKAPDWKGIISVMVYSSSSSSWSKVDGLDDVPVVGFHNPLWFGKRNGRYSLLLMGPRGVLLDYDYSRKVFNEIRKIKMENKPGHAYAFAYELKNNADVWHNSSFHQLQLQNRFAFYASHQTGEKSN